MKISIIISVYNTEKYLHECLNSVVNQTNQNYELIIINDGSKDNSLKIIKEYTKKHKKFILIDKENTGLADSRNKGLDIATGDYVLFLDSDDYLELNAIETIINNIKNNKADIYLYETRYFNKTTTKEDANKKIFNSLPDFVCLDKYPILCKIIRSTPIVYSKKIYNEVRFIPKTIHEDNYFCLKAYSMTKKIFIARNIIYNARTRDDNSSIMQNLNYKTFLDLYKLTLKIDLEIRNKKLVKYHLNQLLIYRHKYVKTIYDKMSSDDYINDYLKEMNEKKIINIFTYLYYRIYKELKKFKCYNKKEIVKKIKYYYYSMLTLISPTLNTKIFFKNRMKKKLDLKNPETINEKISWLKLYAFPNNELVIKCADKFKVREYIKEKNCKEILNDLLFVYDKPEDINWDSLPKQFVLKSNYGCSFNFICKDKSLYKKEVIVKLLKKWQRSKQHLYTAELHYSKIPRKIICEKYLQPDKDGELKDYKIYCCNGKPYLLMLCVDREKGKTKYYYFDENWNFNENLTCDIPDKNVNLDNYKPNNLDELFDYAKILCKDFVQVRVDFYSLNNKIYFGELTFTSCAGLDPDKKPELDKFLGSKIILPLEEGKNE